MCIIRHLYLQIEKVELGIEVDKWKEDEKMEEEDIDWEVMIMMEEEEDMDWGVTVMMEEEEEVDIELPKVEMALSWWAYRRGRNKWIVLSWEGMQMEY